MTKVKILIVEDNIIIAEDLKFVLSDLGYEVLGISMSYFESLEAIELKKPDLCLLDITIRGEKDGIDLGKTINENYGIPFLYITSHSDRITVERAKETKPKGYLIKPFDKDDVYTSIEMALVQSSSAIAPSILIRQNGLLKKILIQEITHLKADGNYVEINTEDHKTYLQRDSIKNYLTQEYFNAFYQIHKSYAVNKKHIQSFNSKRVLMNGKELPMGNKYYSLFKESFKE